MPLRVTARGISTGPIPHVAGMFRIDVDVVGHRLDIVRRRRTLAVIPLEPMAVARFYATLLAVLDDLGVKVAISTEPAEGLAGPTFDVDEEHSTYVAAHALAIWQGFVTADRLLRTLRRSRRGWTPVRLFWGSLDLATSRFAADPAVEQTVGWWPTSPTLGPAFYAYTKPEPVGYRSEPVTPAAARFDAQLGEFILSVEAAGATPNADIAVRAFFVSTAHAGRRRRPHPGRSSIGAGLT